MTTEPSQPIKVFVAYAEEDEQLKDKLEKQLASLRWQGLISGWEQSLMPAIPLHKETKKTLSARLAFRHEAGKNKKARFAYGCHSRRMDSQEPPVV